MRSLLALAVGAAAADPGLPPITGLSAPPCAPPSAALGPVCVTRGGPGAPIASVVSRRGELRECPAAFGEAVELEAETLCVLRREAHPLAPLALEVDVDPRGRVRVANATVVPTQTKLALGGDPQSMAVTFQTDGALTDLATYAPVVLYGQSSGNLSLSAAGDSAQYYETGVQHTVRLEGLEPGAQYFYQVGDASLGLSDERSFRAPPPADQASTDALVIGDMGAFQPDTAAALLAEVEAGGVDLVVLAGDIAYGDDAGWLGLKAHPLVYEAMYDSWGDMIEPVSERVPLMVAPGNHDVGASVSGLRDDPALGNFSAFNHRFAMPWQPSGAVANVYHSFDAGRVHFAFVNTECDYPGAPSTPSTRLGPSAGGFGDQLAWLAADLAAAQLRRDAGELDWLLVVGHRPLIADQRDKDFPPGVQRRTRKAFMPLFEQYGVDAYLCGHLHSYETTFPMRLTPDFNVTATQHDYVDPQGLVQIVNGAAGSLEGVSPFRDDTLPVFRNHWRDGVGYARMRANATALAYSFYAVADGGEASLVDTFSLTRPTAA